MNGEQPGGSGDTGGEAQGDAPEPRGDAPEPRGDVPVPQEDVPAGAPLTGVRPTGRDVARAAGVSQAAVSLVLGEKWRGRVAEATAERVRRSAEELGYRPNLAARSLRLGRTRTALLVVPALTNEFFAGVHAGAARVAAEHGVGVVLYPSPAGIGPAQDPFASAGATLDGVLASSMAARAVQSLRGERLPLVMLDSDPDAGGSAATVNLDIADGMRQVLSHLTALGHRELLHLSAAVDSWTFDVRREVLAASTGPAVRVRMRTAGLSVRAAQEAAHAALAAPGPRLTAVVCDDDVMAAGVCKAARRLGLRIPEDLSVTGFDDLTLASAVEPELTTVHLDAEEFGAAGMDALVAVLAGSTPAPRTLPVHLVVRGSTGPVPG